MEPPTARNRCSACRSVQLLSADYQLGEAGIRCAQGERGGLREMQPQDRWPHFRQKIRRNNKGSFAIGIGRTEILPGTVRQGKREDRASDRLPQHLQPAKKHTNHPKLSRQLRKSRKGVLSRPSTLLHCPLFQRNLVRLLIRKPLEFGGVLLAEGRGGD